MRVSWGSCGVGAQVWMCCWGKTGDSTPPPSRHSPILHRYPVSNQSLGISSQRLLDCWSCHEGSRVALRGWQKPWEKGQQIGVKWMRHLGTDSARMPECRWEGREELILDLLGFTTATGCGCLKTWARLHKCKQACSKLFTLSHFTLLSQFALSTHPPASPPLCCHHNNHILWQAAEPLSGKVEEVNLPNASPFDLASHFSTLRWMTPPVNHWKLYSMC